MDYGQPVRFGVFLTPQAAQIEHTLALSALADELDFDLIGVQDHTYQWRFVDTWTLLTAIAMRTRKIHVFPDVANVPICVLLATPGGVVRSGDLCASSTVTSVLGIGQYRTVHRR